MAAFIHLHKSVLVGHAIFPLEFGRLVVIDLEQGQACGGSRGFEVFVRFLTNWAPRCAEVQNDFAVRCVSYLGWVIC